MLSLFTKNNNNILPRNSKYLKEQQNCLVIVNDILKPFECSFKNDLKVMLNPGGSSLSPTT